MAIFRTIKSLFFWALFSTPGDWIGTNHPYIAMYSPISMWNTIINILESEKQLQIYANNSSGQISAFFGRWQELTIWHLPHSLQKQKAKATSKLKK